MKTALDLTRTVRSAILRKEDHIVSNEGISTRNRDLSQRAGEAANRHRATLEDGPGGIAFEHGAALSSRIGKRATRRSALKIGLMSFRGGFFSREEFGWYRVSAALVPYGRELYVF